MLELIIIIALFITGINIASQEGYLLHPVKQFAESIFTKDGKVSYLFNPIRGCPTCMASFWSIFIYALMNGISLGMVVELFIIIPAVATITTLLDR